ncbi:hypothetical protein PC110_g16626 [Phytophthora cactorum]|uniref:Uncharacterized protein n=1 Tax=Phytophthora cactorum TaxID=29920 RepID=A0A329RUY0_9STRA|nr:hypothetical protein PC110_g16626 [Phytophthora cactorum]
MALSTTHLTGKLPTRTCSTLLTNLSGLAANQENSEVSEGDYRQACYTARGS